MLAQPEAVRCARESGRRGVAALRCAKGDCRHARTNAWRASFIWSRSWPMADVVARGGIGRLRSYFEYTCGRWPMLSPKA
eukprot:7084587-Prymnesium_polylepis.1